ncbi:nucleoporin-like protein 2 [Pomacea canaliculata]|uniref:nucleoporin-like protein 2 n=1 Tax=Pomacea canaliculata TaxID=400727 RepID=UPI000D735366|nr:nucleoporin-like protein 2 [Pomacea canaliculata]
MPVCEFFLKGRCLYGEKCFNEHPRGHGGGGDRGSGSRHVAFRDSFGSGYQQGNNPYKWASSSPQAGSSQTTASADDIVKNIPKEIEIWQTSKTWPFSCIGFEANLPSFPDIPDLSPEELRLEAYMAIQQNTLDQYKLKVSQLAEQYRQWQEQLKVNSTDPSLRHRLVELIEESRRKKNSGSLIRPSLFGGQTASTASSGFGTGASHSSVFGGSSASFAQNVSFSGFGQGSSPSASSTSVFGGNQNSGGGTFGQAGANTGGSFFGTSTSAVLNQSGGNSGSSTSFGFFGQTSSGGGLFGQSPASSSSPAHGFGAQATTSPRTGGLFSALPNQSPSAQGSVFGGASQTKGAMFGQSGGFTNVFQNSSSGSSLAAFPGSGMPTSNQGMLSPGNVSFGATHPGHDSLYTAVDKLTEEEKEQFEAKTFSFGKIPLRPPPKEMINI